MPRLVVSSWYVVNSRWVKNVNNLRNISGLLCVYISTTIQLIKDVGINICVQTNFFKQHLPIHSTTIYTYLTNKFNLLNKSFTYFPHNLLINLKMKFKER